MENNFTQLVKEKEQAVQDQLDRLYDLVHKKTAQSLIQIEYKRLVERITEKYQLLLAQNEQEKESLGEEEYTERANALREQYKEDVVTFAVALDKAIEETAQSTQQDATQQSSNNR